MPGLAALVTGTCSGHGVQVNAHIHGTAPCNAPDPCPPASPVAPQPLATKDATCYWPSLNTLPLDPKSVARTVTIEGVQPLCNGDNLIVHPAAKSSTNIVLHPTGKYCTPKPKPCYCGVLTTEDTPTGVGHPRVVKATTTTVFVCGVALATVGDPLGPPCKSTILTGAKTVAVGTGAGAGAPA